jgi:hypothetical protein
MFYWLVGLEPRLLFLQRQMLVTDGVSNKFDSQ